MARALDKLGLVLDEAKAQKAQRIATERTALVSGLLGSLGLQYRWAFEAGSCNGLWHAQPKLLIKSVHNQGGLLIKR